MSNEEIKEIKKYFVYIETIQSLLLLEMCSYTKFEKILTEEKRNKLNAINKELIKETSTIRNELKEEIPTQELFDCIQPAYEYFNSIIKYFNEIRKKEPKVKRGKKYIEEYVLGRKITINLNIQEILLLDDKIIKSDVKRKLRKLNSEVDEILKDALKYISEKEQKEIIQKVITKNNKY